MPGELYIAPILLWASSDRPLRVEIFKPDLNLAGLAAEFEFVVGRQQDRRGKDVWLVKRYKLDKDRHGGTANLRIGWTDNHQGISSGGVAFLVTALALEGDVLKRQTRINQGLCPECGQLGTWQAMAMVCDKHGVFLG